MVRAGTVVGGKGRHKVKTAWFKCIAPSVMGDLRFATEHEPEPREWTDHGFEIPPSARLGALNGQEFQIESGQELRRQQAHGDFKISTRSSYLHHFFEGSKFAC